MYSYIDRCFLRLEEALRLRAVASKFEAINKDHAIFSMLDRHIEDEKRRISRYYRRTK